MKKFLSLTFLILILISFKNVEALEDKIVFTNNQNVVVRETRFLELLDSGYTFEDVYNMDLNTYNNASTEITDGAVTTKYLKTTTTTRFGVTTSETVEVTEAEYLSSPDESYSTFASGTVESTYKKMTASITTSTNNSNYKLYKVYMYWKQMPSTRSYDIIGMGFESSLVEPVYSADFSNFYTYNGETHFDYVHTQKSSTNGKSAVFELPDNDIVTLGQELKFEVEKIYSSAINILDCAGDYAHATSTVSESSAVANHYMGIQGLVLNSTISSKYDTMSSAEVYWTGSW